MTEKARCGTKRVVVEMELVKEEYIERCENEVFSELKTRLAPPRQGMSMYVEVGWGKKVSNQPARRLKGACVFLIAAGPKGTHGAAL